MRSIERVEESMRRPPKGQGSMCEKSAALSNEMRPWTVIKVSEFRSNVEELRWNEFVTLM